jgi:hypothetical protein
VKTRVGARIGRGLLKSENPDRSENRVGVVEK